MKNKIMIRNKIGNLLVSILYIESQLKCLLKEILSPNLKSSLREVED